MLPILRFCNPSPVTTSRLFLPSRQFESLRILRIFPLQSVSLRNVRSSTFVTHEWNHSKCIPTNRPQTTPAKKRFDRVRIRLNPGLSRKSRSANRIVRKLTNDERVNRGHRYDEEFSSKAIREESVFNL